MIGTEVLVITLGIHATLSSSWMAQNSICKHATSVHCRVDIRVAHCPPFDGDTSHSNVRFVHIAHSTDAGDYATALLRTRLAKRFAGPPGGESTAAQFSRRSLPATRLLTHHCGIRFIQRENMGPYTAAYPSIVSAPASQSSARHLTTIAQQFVDLVGGYICSSRWRSSSGEETSLIQLRTSTC